MSELAFYLLATPTVLAASGVLFLRNPVHCALSLVAALFLIAVGFAALGAHLIAALQIVVYAGAVMVLFLFVIMLLNLRGEEDLGPTSPPVNRITKYVVSLLLIVELAFIVKTAPIRAVATGVTGIPVDDFGSVRQVAETMYTEYLYPFEVAAVILLVAIVAAITLTMRKRPGQKLQDVSKQVAVRAKDRIRIVKMDAEGGQ